LEDSLIFSPIENLRDAEFKLRRVRDAVFPKGYFSDAAWDILLDLDRAGRNQQTYVVTDAGIDAKIPHSTALRYLAKLERDGFVQRVPDPGDKRRAFISLTAYGQNLLDRVFTETIIETISANR
jgi:DNA-binding MarR family transcriptional regulator